MGHDARAVVRDRAVPAPDDIAQPLPGCFFAELLHGNIVPLTLELRIGAARKFVQFPQIEEFVHERIVLALVLYLRERDLGQVLFDIEVVRVDKLIDARKAVLATIGVPPMPFDPFRIPSNDDA